MFVYVNGDLVAEEHATISVLDHSFLYGDGVFEGISVDRGRIFRLDAHLARLLRSAERLRISSFLSFEQLKEAVVQVVATNGLRDGYVRPILSRGTGPIGIGYTREIKRPNIVIIPQVRPRLSDEQRLVHGLAAKVLDIRRTPPQCLDPSVKSNNYLNQILGKWEQWDAGVDIGIMLDVDGAISECCGENIFLVKGEVLRTPPAHNILNGITRQAIMELWRREDHEVSEEPLTAADLLAADEVFVTATLIEVAAITVIDGRTIGTGEGGPITRRLLKLLREEMFSTGLPVDYDGVRTGPAGATADG